MRDNKERFIEKARKVHGGKYDYSKVKYVDSTTKVYIICPQHGEFHQTPQEHLRGRESFVPTMELSCYISQPLIRKNFLIRFLRAKQSYWKTLKKVN
jgi:hypothetical protein